MIWNPFKVASRGFLGVDIGTFSIKIVEMSRAGKRKKLENYGEIQAEALYQKPFRTFEKSTLTLSTKDIVKAITAVLREADMRSTKAIFSIPDFSTFFTTITLPGMTEQELPQAVTYEARQHIPLPMSDVTLDWQVIEKNGDDPRKPDSLKILLVAVPNDVISQYQEIAQGAGLQLLSLEAEVFSLARALVGEEEKEGTVSLVDLGARSTTINIIDRGILKLSHSFDTSGSDFTMLISKGLNMDYMAAEELKKNYGLLPSETKTREMLQPFVDLIVNEIKKIASSFYQTDRKEVQKIVLAGASALMPGLKEYFVDNLKKPVEIGNPFVNIFYPPILEETIRIAAPTLTIAVGASLGGIE
jgi:type IV pilus assembly protein PilM